MIELELLNYLINCQITGIGNNVFMEVPAKNIPDKYILLEKTGSHETDRIYSASFAIQSISKNSLFEAATINSLVIEAMDSMRDIANVYSAHLNSDYNFTDTDTKEYRYQAVYEIYYN